MLTKFDLFINENIDKLQKSKINKENMKLEIENNIENNVEEFTNKIINEFSFIIYKQRKRPKNLRVKKLEGYYNKKDFKNYNLIYKTKIIIELSNFDIIEGELSIYNNKNENNIKIKINNDIVYNLDNPNFNDDKLIEKMKMKYQNHIKKKFKIK